MATKLRSRDLDKRVRLERQAAAAAEDIRSAGSTAWVLVDELWAKLADERPVLSEGAGEGVQIATRQSRIWLRYRSDIVPGMRFVFGARVMQITNGPATVGTNEFAECLVEEYSTAGQPA